MNPLLAPIDQTPQDLYQALQTQHLHRILLRKALLVRERRLHTRHRQARRQRASLLPVVGAGLFGFGDILFVRLLLQPTHSNRLASHPTRMLDNALIHIIQRLAIAVVIQIYLHQCPAISCHAAEDVLDDVAFLPAGR